MDSNPSQTQITHDFTPFLPGLQHRPHREVRRTRFRRPIARSTNRRYIQRRRRRAGKQRLRQNIPPQNHRRRSEETPPPHLHPRRRFLTRIGVLFTVSQLRQFLGIRIQIRRRFDRVQTSPGAPDPGLLRRFIRRR